MTATHVANEEMAAAWDGPEGEHWTAYADKYERVGSRHWQRLLDRVQVASDAVVLDIGCGTGGSTRNLARIATEGSVLGIDLSSRMLRHAADQARAEGLDNVRFDRGDAQVHAFDSQAYDVAISVFGAMFFDDPVAAFTNIRTGLRPGATLALLSWQELARNDWLVSLRETLGMGRDLPQPPTGAPGPFGLADPDHIRRVLGESGFGEVRLDDVELPMEFGRDVDGTLAFMSVLGLTKGLLHDLDDDAKVEALGNLRKRIGERETSDGVLFGSSAWLVTATA